MNKINIKIIVDKIIFPRCDFGYVFSSFGCGMVIAEIFIIIWKNDPKMKRSKKTIAYLR